MKYKNTKRRKRIEKIVGSGDGMCGVERGESGLQIPRTSAHEIAEIGESVVRAVAQYEIEDLFRGNSLGEVATNIMYIDIPKVDKENKIKRKPLPLDFNPNQSQSAAFSIPFVVYVP
jgi:hypothetical protein